MQLITYLTFAGNCEEAINFYKEALGGKIILLSRMGDGPMEVPEQLRVFLWHHHYSSFRFSTLNS